MAITSKVPNAHTRAAGIAGSRCRKVAGFTLLELMITVAIVAILATIAYASYSNQIVKSRRAAAANCLQERAQFMERFYTTNMTYAAAPDPPQCGPDLNPFYAVEYVGLPDARTFVIRGRPLGAQLAGDAKCAILGINAQGDRTASGTSSATPGDCW